jgi:hypothetical protein
MRNPITVATALGAMVLVAGTVISADTIVLRNGRRVTGSLVAIQDGIIQFREGGNRRQMLRLDRDEVSRIELDDPDRQHGGTGDTLPRPRGMREREVIVSADVPWVDTAIDVRAGQTVYFEAIGHVWWGRNRKDGPAGERDSPYNPGRPMPRRPAAALIARWGRSQTTHSSSATIEVRYALARMAGCSWASTMTSSPTITAISGWSCTIRTTD